MLEFLGQFLFDGIVEFVYWYPALMAMMWVIGSIIFYCHNERHGALPLKETPMVSILMPAHNESDILYTVENGYLYRGKSTYSGDILYSINGLLPLPVLVMMIQ